MNRDLYKIRSMSHTLINKDIILEITGQLYPEIAAQLKAVSALKELHAEDPGFENTFDILNELKSEFVSLSNYEIKLLFPTLLNAADSGTITDENCCHIAELQTLLRKKEDHIRDLVLELEVESENLIPDKENRIVDLIILFRHNFIKSKELLHKNLLQMQSDKTQIN